MITEIGITAGEIWKLLDKESPLEFQDLLQKVPGGEDIGLMALGWLCREGHVLIGLKDGKIYVQLKK